MRCRLATLFVLCLISGFAFGADPPKIKVLIVDGYNNHNWKTSTPILRKILEATNRFTVDVATAPQDRKDLPTFKPKFADYHVVMSNYNSDGSVTRTPDADWSAETQKAFVDYVDQGGGFVVVHAADNSFPNWKEYNEIIGVGGWGRRDGKTGTYIYYKNDKLVRDESPGKVGWHGPEHSFAVVNRNREHPITKGMPPMWMHTKDELYSHMRGPAANVEILATAFSPKELQGRDVDEPVLMTITYGKGRVFHTALGHESALRCAGLVAFLQRGTEWCATGKVTIPLPDDFPTTDARESSIFKQ